MQRGRCTRGAFASSVEALHHRRGRAKSRSGTENDPRQVLFQGISRPELWRKVKFSISTSTLVRAPEACRRCIARFQVGWLQVWDHPCDEFHRLLYKKERAKKPRPQTHSDRTFRDACVVRAGRRPRRCSEAFSARAFSARREGHTMGGTAEAARACCLLLMSLNMRSLNYTL